VDDALAVRGEPLHDGPRRDFTVDVPAAASCWPAEGPKRIGTRLRGEGYSAVVGDSARLYTLCREGTDEVIVALDADIGITYWEHCHNAAL